MKKWLIFIGGIVTGIVLTLFVLIVIAVNKDTTTSTDEKLTLFEKPGDLIDTPSFEVFQVLEDNAALVRGVTNVNYDIYTGPVYLIKNDEGKYYYDDEIIKTPRGKVVRQVGIYRYETKSEDNKTVPVIEIMDE